MKPHYLPLYRDAGRLLVPDLSEFSKASSVRGRRCARAYGKQAMRLLAWPNAKWWRALAVAGESVPFESRHPSRDEAVIASWTRLGEFRRWEAASFADAIHLLVETPSVETFGNGPMPEGGVDPRPWFGDRESLRAWLVAKSALWEAALERLRADGRVSGEALIRLRRYRPSEALCPDLHALVFFGFTGDLRSLRWDERLVRSTLPFFRGGALRQVRAAADLVEEMMGGATRDIALVQRFLAETRSETSAPWLALVATVRDPERRRHFLERLAASDARLESPHRITTRLVQQIEQRARRHRRIRLELAGLFTVVRRRLDPAVLEDGFGLAELFPSAKIVVSLAKGQVVRPELARFAELAERFSRDDQRACRCAFCGGARIFQRLWKAATTSREVAREIAAATWRELPEVATRDWIDLLLGLHGMKLRVREFRGLVDRVRRSILREPTERRRVKAAALAQLIGYANGRPEEAVLDDFETLAATVATGFKKLPYDALSLFDDFYRVATADQRWSLGNLGRSVVNHLAEAARSGQDEELVRKGGERWLRGLPEADLAVPFRRPKRFLDALRELGALHEAEAAGICAYLAGHPGFGVNPGRIGLRDACCLFDAILRAGEKDPLPDKLREAACGRVVLSREAMAHYRAEFAARLADYQIDLLFARVRELDERYRSEGLDPHTVRFLANLGKSNRRAMKRFLQALREGRERYREAHPANGAWLRRHGHLSLGEWIAGEASPHPVSLVGYEGAYVRLEDDPQETLKMGTYADTCLALGGCNQHAAVANSLDLNKRVAYLRSGEGRPLARQLLAISEEEELVPFPVYTTAPAVPREECERLFREFDRALAERLGIPLWRSGSDFRIPALVARDWYCDEAWRVEE